MAFAYAAFFLLVICIYKPASSQQNHSNLISLGSSISTNVQPTSWRSPSGTFAFGFYPQGSGFIVGIWLVCKPADIITWTAYRDDPPVPSNATLEFTVNGKLLLRTYSANNEAGEEKLIAKIEKSASNARMFDSGNLVLYNEHSDAIWESFNFPTDTILGGQNLYAGGELLSSASTTDFSTGRFRLKMQSDGNLVLYPVATLDIAADAYWSTDTFGSSGTHLYLNYTGELLILNKTSGIVRDVFNSYSKSESSSIIYRATLENNGIFKLYSHNFDSNGAYTTSLNDSAPESQCKVKTFCGLNSYCTMNDDQPDCRCLPGTVPVDPDQRYNGCERNYTEQLCKVAEETSSYNITDMEKMSWDDNPYFRNSMSEEDCRKSCLQDCNCAGALYESGECKKVKFPVKYARRLERDSSKVFFKVGLKSVRSIATAMKPPVVLKTSKKTVTLIFVMSVAFITCSSIAIAVSVFFISKSRVVKARMRRNIETNVSRPEEVQLSNWAYELMVARELDKLDLGEDVDLQNLEKMGNGFAVGIWMMGQPNNTVVWTANRDDEPVSINATIHLSEEGKLLLRTEQGNENLIANVSEVAASASMLDSGNFVLSNGSSVIWQSFDYPTDTILGGQNLTYPDKLVSSVSSSNHSSGRFLLAMQEDGNLVAYPNNSARQAVDAYWASNTTGDNKGLSLYLNHQGFLSMVTVSKKPVLLARSSYPCNNKTTIFRATLDADGIFRSSIKVDVSTPDEMNLPSWAYQCFAAGQLDKLVKDEDIEFESLERMVKIGLLCVQRDPTSRPCIKNVILMLEGSGDIPAPSAIAPFRSTA
ncbi:hypothetical protein NC653_040753 [Populus alba x Populus x berolinensis]|uniref:Receptor-like serine/threonine-protein kinase n=1 Tax=Populus alba x Populus x berolinensis TaxID=444605 RepID=A0AAD6PQ03_9ROSI|nr:hypothetical protein NC653_040753 [Populus alba x Populus x berolinensis]